jgi:proteasome lid subunit RPN8/RPN11
VITKKDGGSVTVEDPIKLERFSKFEQEFVKRFDEGGLVTADKTQAPVEESAAFGIYPKSGVPSATPEAQAKALEFSKNLADLVVPQTTADVAMMAMPYGKVGKMIGAGLIAANPNEAGAAMFPRLAVDTLGFMAEHYPESFKAVKEALEKTLKTGNEYAVVHNPYETILHTSNKPDKVMMTPQMMSNMNENVYKPTDTFMMHTHPYGGVGPSKADIKMTAQNPARQIISSPQGDSIIAIDPGKRFSGNSYDSYIDDAQKHIQSEKVQNFLQSKGYLGYGQYNDIEGLASKMAPHEYLRNLATQNRLDYRYNDLGMHTPENSDLDAVPFADILESYWREFYPGSVVEKQPVKKAEGGQVKKKSTIDDLEEDPVLIERKLKLMGLI